jgi:hypothetical protein
MADSKSKSGAPSFYSAAADMQMNGQGGAKPPAAGGDAGNSAEEAKIVATLLEVIEKWSTMTKDPKRKEKIQQIASIAKEIQTGMGGDAGKAMPSESAAPAPDAMGAGGGSGAPPGAGTPTPPPM